MPAVPVRKKPEARTCEPLAFLKGCETGGKSGAVTQALLMAVLLHAFLALVLIDFGLTAFLNGAHGVCVRGWFAMKDSGNDFVERVFDDALGPDPLQLGDDVAHDDFVNHRLDREPTFF